MTKLTPAEQSAMAHWKRKKEALVTEDTVEDHLRLQAKARGGVAAKISMLEGWPDRLVLLPGGWLAWVELKRPVGGKFEPMQPMILRLLRKLGFRVFVCKTKAEVDKVFKEYDNAET